MKITKLNLVNVPVEFQQEEGCVAFQMIEIKYSFYGQEMVDRFDTKITSSGEQFIIDGNGYIKSGTRIEA